MTCHEAEPLLHARLDNELDAAGAVRIEQHLLECRTCAAQYAALENLHQEIAAADLQYPVPASLERKIANQLQPKSWVEWMLGSTAVKVTCAAAFLLVVFLIPTLRQSSDGGESELLDIHLRALQPSHLVDVPSSDKHTVKPWFQGRVSFSPAVPDLGADGFELVGGRLEVIERENAAALVYKRRLHIISLFVTATRGADAAVTSAKVNGYHLVRWKQGGMNYQAISDLDPLELRKFADLVRTH